MADASADGAAPAPNPWKVWIGAARPRTLPLALSSIFLGSGLAHMFRAFQWPVFSLAVLTTVLLQILSNLANDYGDSIHGADLGTRQGPQRAVASGQVSLPAMRRAVVALAVASFLSGLALLWASFGSDWTEWLRFLALGVAAIAAAILYTNGKRPYGYAGLGDLAVLLFFGPVGVMGVLYLYTLDIEAALFGLYPSLAVGLFSTAVLNVNNVRDRTSDIQAGKYSIPVRLGETGGRVYHLVLLSLALAMAVLGTLQLPFIVSNVWAWAVSSPLFVWNGYKVFTERQNKKLNPLLGQLAMSTLLFALLFAYAGWYLGHSITFCPGEWPDDSVFMRLRGRN